MRNIIYNYKLYVDTGINEATTESPKKSKKENNDNLTLN